MTDPNQNQNVEPTQSEEQKNHRMWAMFCHLSGLLFLTGIPFANILGPLVIWLIKKNEMPLVNENGKEALNFQISMTIYALVAALLILIIIGGFLLMALAIANVVLSIVAGVKTNNGEKFTYPSIIRLIK